MYTLLRAVRSRRTPLRHVAILCLVLGTGLRASADPVEDLRAADALLLEQFSGRNTVAVEYSFFGTGWYSLPAEGFTNHPGCMPKERGTLDIDLNPLLPDYNLSGLKAEGTSHPDHVVVWELDNAINEDVSMEVEGTNVTVTVTHAAVKLTAQATSVPVFYAVPCQRVFNCTFERHGGDNENRMIIHFYMDEEARNMLGAAAGLEAWMLGALTGNGRITTDQIDFHGSSGDAEAPAPEITAFGRDGNEWVISGESLLANAPYEVREAKQPGVPEAAWTRRASFTAGGTSHTSRIPESQGSTQSLFRIQFQPPD